MTRVFIPQERCVDEHRVAATPETVKKLVQRGFTVIVEAGAGVAAEFRNEDYAAAGATIGADRKTEFSSADVILKVGALELPDAADPGTEIELKSGAVVIGLLAPHKNLDAVRLMAAAQVTSLSLELLPRVTRAQSMDALSSQASVAGYKAVILAASRLKRYFPLLMTAAGTIPPARVIIMGGGVAGLQALATAKRLGAVVEVSDIRATVKEQVESLGGRFIDLPLEESGEGLGGYAKEMGEDFLKRQREIVAQHVSKADVVISTAQVPGKPAPRLISARMVEAMRPGSVIVDLAAEQGGNCELCVPGEEIDHDGVLILGPLNLAATLAHAASTLYSRNVLALLLHLAPEGKVQLNPDDEIQKAALLTHEGVITHPATAARMKEDLE
ncbi:MAG: Re/Si-specific NAD(P)(+) transhydrogenase subunit alpha [Thermoanaerobaculia bacterium]